MVNGRQEPCHVGDWIVSDGDRVIYVCDSETFEQVFEPTGEARLEIRSEDRKSLADCLGFGSTESSQTLALSVQRLARLTIGDIPVQFTVSQWQEIARRAEKRRMTPMAYMQQLVERLTQDLWTSAE